MFWNLLPERIRECKFSGVSCCHCLSDSLWRERERERKKERKKDKEGDVYRGPNIFPASRVAFCPSAVHKGLKDRKEERKKERGAGNKLSLMNKSNYLWQKVTWQIQIFFSFTRQAPTGTKTTFSIWITFKLKSFAIRSARSVDLILFSKEWKQKKVPAAISLFIGYHLPIPLSSDVGFAWLMGVDPMSQLVRFSGWGGWIPVYRSRRPLRLP